MVINKENIPRTVRTVTQEYVRRVFAGFAYQLLMMILRGCGAWQCQIVFCSASVAIVCEIDTQVSSPFEVALSITIVSWGHRFGHILTCCAMEAKSEKAVR